VVTSDISHVLSVDFYVLVNGHFVMPDPTANVKCIF